MKIGILLLGLGLACASSPTVRPASLYRPCPVENDFALFRTHDLDESACTRGLLVARQAIHELGGLLGSPSGPVRIFLYASQQAYNERRLVPIESLADYNINTNEIHIAMNADLIFWKHELSHALLEMRMPGAPFWLHEGLAYFAQHQNFSRQVNCQKTTVASLPGHLQSYLPRIARQTHLPARVNLNLKSSREDFLTGTVDSIFYVFYLWHRRALQATLEEGVPRRPAAEFYQPDASYRPWLQSAYPAQLLPGC
ncbi:MAG: hypothetical protein HS115_12695 [Spirochaetales bacterium]|nr:hypothetical protein [Spirochaetales bacterium]